MTLTTGFDAAKEKVSQNLCKTHILYFVLSHTIYSHNFVEIPRADCVLDKQSAILEDITSKEKKKLCK